MEKRLFLTAGVTDALRGLCYAFLRTSPKAITVANVTTEIIFAQVDANNGRFLPAFEQTLNTTILPLCKSLEVCHMPLQLLTNDNTVRSWRAVPPKRFAAFDFLTEMTK